MQLRQSVGPGELHLHPEVLPQIWQAERGPLHQCQVNTLPIIVLPIELDSLLGQDTVPNVELDML